MLLIGLVLMVFLLMARTRLFRAGQVGELMSKYCQFLGITIVHFLMFFGTRIYRVVRAQASRWHPPPRPAVRVLAGALTNRLRLACLCLQMAVLDYTPHVGIWHLPMFFVLFILQKIVQLVWYHHVIKTARSLLEELLAESRKHSS